MLFGDSIAAGLGARGQQYLHVLAAALDLEVIDRSNTGATVTDSRLAFDADPQDADVAVIAHGVTEPILRPVLPEHRWFPQRWRALGWMDPRPYYSSRRRRRVLERLESGLRWRVKNALLRRDRYQLLSEDDYVTSLAAFAATLQGRGIRVLVVQPPPIEERYFPGSRQAQAAYWSAAQRVPGIELVHLDGMHEWEHFLLDRFHPNVAGHAFIAQRIIGRLSA